jgi:hypothetical protein
LTTISFPIPLKEGKEGYVYAVLDKEETEEEAGTNGCTGTVEKPTAPEGKLCVYTAEEENIQATKPLGELFASFQPVLEEGYLATGAALQGLSAEGSSSKAAAAGTWAVTAP